MRTFLNDFLLQLKGIWSRLDGGQRLVVTSVLLATMVGLGAMVWFAGQPTYVVVFNAKSADEIAAARKALDGKVGYVVGDGGMQFMVDRSKATIAQSMIAEAGLFAEGGGTDIGASSIIDDAETKAWKLAQASIGRAQNAVRQLEGVTRVDITANKPKRRSAFRDRDHENRPSATVLLKLRPGTAFESTAYTAASLTSSQLGIPLENVTVSNAAGGARWSYDPDREAGGGSAEFLALQRTMGRNRAALAQERLDQMWPNKTSVVVNVELDPSWEVVSQKVLAEPDTRRSEKITKESTNTQSGTANTSPLTSQAGSDPATKNDTKNETTDIEYVTEIGERRSGKLAPEVKRLTVAVFYDRSLEAAADFSRDQLSNAVKAMVGWDKARDSEDSFSVLPGDFAPIEPVELSTSSNGVAEIALQWGPTIGQVFGVIVVVFFLRGLFKRSRRTATAPGASPLPVAATNELSPEENQIRMRREIERAIASDPAALAKLLETWLIEQSA